MEHKGLFKTKDTIIVANYPAGTGIRYLECGSLLLGLQEDSINAIFYIILFEDRKYFCHQNDFAFFEKIG